MQPLIPPGVRLSGARRTSERAHARAHPQTLLRNSRSILFLPHIPGTILAFQGDMLRSISTIMLFAFTTIGCSSGNITTDDLDEALSQYDGDSSAELIKPRNGSWTYTSTDIASDTCSNLIDMVEVGSGFEVVRSGSSFTLTLDGSDTNADCALGGDQFDCSAIGETATPESSVTFHSTTVTKGAMHTPDSMEGAHELDISCEGSGCTILEVAKDVNFPCRFGVFYTAISG